MKNYIHQELVATDPEYVELFERFAYDEVPTEIELDDRTRSLVVIATLLGLQGIDEYKVYLKSIVTLMDIVAIKEVIYQSTAYLGIGRVYPFLLATNEIMKEAGISLPLPSQKTTRESERLIDGELKQIEIFGEHMRGFASNAPSETRHINKWLVANCFGDYYTRTGLTTNERELVTFCYLAAQGGCEPQLTSHAMANIKVGNTSDILIKAVSTALPYMGYPRSLNALRCVKEASK